MNVLLDTNVLARWLNPQDPLHRCTIDALHALKSAGHTPTLVPQNLYEFWTIATRPIKVNGFGFSVDDTSAKLSLLVPPHFLLLQDERAILSRWRRLVETYKVTGKPAHDARLVAAMLRHGLTHLLTFNTTDFSRYTEIEAVDPEQLATGAYAFPS